MKRPTCPYPDKKCFGLIDGTDACSFLKKVSDKCSFYKRATKTFNHDTIERDIKEYESIHKGI